MAWWAHGVPPVESSVLDGKGDLKSTSPGSNPDVPLKV